MTYFAPANKSGKPTLIPPFGVEGAAAKIYWSTLAQSRLLTETFQGREGRGATDVVNAALNYGYAILQSYVWSALDNAGLELYCGLFHTERPGKPSLVLDCMEEYRAWVVDRNIIKLRNQLEEARFLKKDLKAAIINSIDDTMAQMILWKGKRVRLENILQRQAYRLTASIVQGKRYKGLRFKW